MVTKSFRLTKKEVMLLEREALRRGVSQSDVVRELIRSLMDYKEREISEVERLFEEILNLYQEQRKELKEMLEKIEKIVRSGNGE